MVSSGAPKIPNMDTLEEINLRHALDLPSRVAEVVDSCENAPKELSMATISMMLQSILSRHRDAAHQVKCRQADAADGWIGD